MARFNQQAMYTLTPAGAKYSPKPGGKHDHTANWQAIVTACKAAGDAGASGAALYALAATMPNPVQQANHGPYLGYAVRSGWLAVVQPAQPAQPAKPAQPAQRK